MADNIAVKPSTDATAVNVRTDEVSSVHWQAAKIAIGADNEAAFVDGGVQEQANSLPVVPAQKSGTLYTAAGITASHPEDLVTAGYKYLTLYWKTTLCGTCYLAVTAYDLATSSPGDTYFLGRTASITADVNEVALTVPLCGAQKVKVSHVVSGNLTSVTYYVLHN
jgi:hypothetical protein